MDSTATAGIVAAWTAVITFVPKLIAALVIFAIGYFVAKFVGDLVAKLLHKVRFDHAVERGGIKAALQRSGYDLSDIIAKLAYYAIMLFTLQLAFGVFGPNPISDLLNRVIAYLPNVFVAVAIIVVCAFVASAVKDLIQASLGGLSYGQMLATVASACVLVVGIFAALNQLNIAPAIVNGLFYAMLAIVVGSAIVAVGGGGIVPMRGVWERTLARAQEEAPKLRSQMQSAAPLRVEQGGLSSASNASATTYPVNDAQPTVPPTVVVPPAINEHVAQPDYGRTGVPEQSTGTDDSTAFDIYGNRRSA
jgi:hypothetical protein